MAKSGPDSNSHGYKATVTNQGDTGEQFQGDWPADGFILPGTATADQKAGAGQYVQGSNGRGNVPWKGGK